MRSSQYRQDAANGAGGFLTSQEAVERGYGCQCAMKAKKEEEARKPMPGQRTIFDYLEGGKLICTMNLMIILNQVNLTRKSKS